MFGAGLEYGAWGNWSWKLEYNFMDFGHRNIHFDNFVLSCIAAVSGATSTPTSRSVS